MGGEEAAKKLEDFWLELAEKTTPSFLPDNLREYYSSMSAALWGNPKAFEPKFGIPNPWHLAYSKPYLFDLKPLKKTLKKYIDFKIHIIE